MDTHPLTVAGRASAGRRLGIYLSGTVIALAALSGGRPARARRVGALKLVLGTGGGYDDHIFWRFEQDPGHLAPPGLRRIPTVHRRVRLNGSYTFGWLTSS